MLTTRIQYIDVCKGIGIIGVILGHLVTYDSYIFKLIFAVHMPLFFFCSGILFRPQKKIRSKILNAFVSPYLFFLLVGVIIYGLTGRLNIDLSFFTALYRGTPNVDSSLWFIVVLGFCCYFFNCLIQKYEYKKISVIIIFACLVEFVMSYFDCKWIPLKLECVPIALSFYALGYIANGISIVERITYYRNKTKWIIFCFCIILYCILVHFNSTVNIAIPHIGNPILFYINALIGISVIIFISITMKNNKILAYIGSRSLIFFLMDEFFRYLYIQVLTFFTGSEYVAMKNLPMKYSLLGTLVILISCTLFYKIINASYVKFKGCFIQLTNVV